MRKGNRGTFSETIKNVFAGTEAQMRAALHAHILCWFRPRRSNAPVLQAVKRTAPGTEPKQRPRAQKVEEFADKDYREDNMYQNADVARVVTEMVRPYVRASADGVPWGSFGWPHLRVAGLARIIQTKLYLHQCSTKYCLQNRTSCKSGELSESVL